jgi:hypothetical protein
MSKHSKHLIALARAPNHEGMRDSVPCRVHVGAVCSPPVCPSLALGAPVVPGPFVVVAANRAVLVLQLELP